MATEMKKSNKIKSKTKSEAKCRMRKEVREKIGKYLELSFNFLQFHTVFQVKIAKKYQGIIGLPVVGSMCQTMPENYVDPVKFSRKNSTKNPQRAKYCAKFIAKAQKCEFDAWKKLVEEFIKSLKPYCKEVYGYSFSANSAQKVRMVLESCYQDKLLINTIRREAFNILCRCVSKPLYKKSFEYFSQHTNNFPNTSEDLESLLNEPICEKIIEKLLIPLIYKQLSTSHLVYHEEPPFTQCRECGEINVLIKRRPGLKYCSDNCRTAEAWRARKILGTAAKSSRVKTSLTNNGVSRPIDVKPNSA